MRKSREFPSSMLSALRKGVEKGALRLMTLGIQTQPVNYPAPSRLIREQDQMQHQEQPKSQKVIDGSLSDQYGEQFSRLGIDLTEKWAELGLKRSRVE